MQRRGRFRFLSLAVVSFCAIAALELRPGASISTTRFTVGSEVIARTGGRAGGGSFGSSTSESSSEREPKTRRSQSNSSTPSTTDPISTLIGVLTFFIVVGGLSYFGFRKIIQQAKQAEQAKTQAVENYIGQLSPEDLSQKMAALDQIPKIDYRKISNNAVTISQLQVALVIENVALQTKLAEIGLTADTATAAGLFQLFQRSVSILLGMPEHWTHVLASSQTCNTREKAQALFHQLSLAERRKVSVETLSNVNGRIHTRSSIPSKAEAPAYLVVTLLIGTAHDHPLFEAIHSAAALAGVLKQLTTIPADYLMVFELLWSPQAEATSLTYDDLLTQYTNLIQIA